MFRNHDAYLNQLEAMALNEDLERYYLWPRTPIRDTLQEEVTQRVGASDFDLSQEHSRPAQIIKFISKLLSERFDWRALLHSGFALWDAIVLWQIKKTFRFANVMA